MTTEEVSREAKRQKKVTDAGERWAEITEWLGSSGLAWERHGSIEVDFDVTAAREQWEEEMDEEGESATQGDGGSRRR